MVGINAFLVHSADLLNSIIPIVPIVPAGLQ
jgi:hypothetical protein